MKISTLFYVLGQGIKSTFKNKWFSLASIAMPFFFFLNIFAVPPYQILRPRAFLLTALAEVIRVNATTALKKPSAVAREKFA